MFVYYLTHQLLIAFMLMQFTLQQKQDPAFMETYKGYIVECAKENGLELDYVNNIWEQHHFPNDNKLKCYFKCMALKLGVMNEKGDVIDEVLQTVSAQFSDEATEKEIVVECGAIEGADLCETAFTLMACIRSAELD